MRKSRIISVANSKGGVGKSTVTMFLAVALASHKKAKVIILDTDNQRTISDYSEAVEDSLVTVEAVAPQRIPNFISRWGGDYDYIFIDIPRITAKKAENNILAVLNCCDSILVPVIGSQVDLLATLDFIEILEGVEADRKKDKLKTAYYGFINRHNRRKEISEVLEYLKDSPLKMFDTYLSDLKAFSNPDLNVPALKTSKERFTPFYMEFIKKYKL